MTGAGNAHEFLTSEEVIQQLLARPELRQRAATCVLPAVRVGSEWRFRRADLEAWIKTQLTAPPALAS
jgi:excisionase family DNA binding protein